jgi:hypothetical protein
MSKNNCPLIFFPDNNYLVVPTAGCWARPDFLEIVDRTIFTKAIVALDGSEQISSLGGLSGIVTLASDGDEAASDILDQTLSKLVNCIVANNGVTPVDTSLCAYVINSSTQQILASSNSSGFDYSYKSSIVSDIHSNQIPFITFENALANPSSFFEFVQKDVLDPTGQGYAYRYVIYVNEYYRLVIHVRLTANQQYVPVCKQSNSECNVCEEDENSESNEEGTECSNYWQPL